MGGEQSGHLIFREYTTTGDGIITALQVLALMRRTGARLSELASVLKTMPQVLVNLKVKRKPRIEEVGALRDAIDRAKESLGGTGRVLVRYSGTEPLLRVMIEGQDQGQIREWADRIVAAASRELC